MDDSKTLFRKLAVPPCSPFSSIKEDIRSTPKQDPGYRQYICIYNNNRPQRGNTGTKPTSDPRFRSQRFRDAVHLCLDYLGYKHTMSEFRRLDSQLNWIELARNLSGQRYTGPEYDLEIVAKETR